jgi:hypothetical protein
MSLHRMKIGCRLPQKEWQNLFPSGKEQEKLIDYANKPLPALPVSLTQNCFAAGFNSFASLRKALPDSVINSFWWDLPHEIFLIGRKLAGKFCASQKILRHCCNNLLIKMIRTSVRKMDIVEKWKKTCSCYQHTSCSEGFQSTLRKHRKPVFQDSSPESGSH